MRSISSFAILAVALLWSSLAAQSVRPTQKTDAQIYEDFRAWVATQSSSGDVTSALDRYRQVLAQQGLEKPEVDRRLKVIVEQGRTLEVERWNRILTSPTAPFNREPNAFLVQVVKGRPIGKALDVGMGQGRNAIFLAQQGWTVTGFDPADKAIAAAKAEAKRLGVPLTALTVGDEEFDFGREQWDLIVLSYVGLRHLTSRVYDSLKPGGMVVVEGFHRDATRGASIGGAVVFDTNELLTLFDRYRVVRYEDTEAVADFGLTKTRVVRLAAEKRAPEPRPDSTSNPRFDALVSLADAKMKEYGVPGVALGVVSGADLSIRALGVTNVEDPLPVTAHTVFPIASISKTFAATAVMRLVEQGKVDLHAPVRTYLPEFRVRDETASRDATVWHLLTHLGGWEGQISGPERGSDTLKNFVGSMSDLMQVAPPGKAWSYNNAGFSIAGRVIERVTGTSINRAIADLVLKPLGLEHAGTTAGDFIVNRFAAGHATRDGKTILQRPFSPSTSVTAGGVGLCITDLLSYARFQMGDGVANGERILKRESLDQMRAVQAHKQGTDDDIGLAWHIRQVGPIRTYGHGGTLAGHILLLEIVPERSFAIAILTNSNTGWKLIQDVEREALKSYLGASYAPNQAIAHRGLVETIPSVQPLAMQPDPAPYLGTFVRPNNSYVVRSDGGRLFVQDRSNSGGSGTEWPVAFYGPDRLFVTDGPDRGQSIEFVRDGNGRVKWIRVVGRVAVREPI